MPSPTWLCTPSATTSRPASCNATRLLPGACHSGLFRRVLTLMRHLARVWWLVVRFRTRVSYSCGLLLMVSSFLRVGIFDEALELIRLLGIGAGLSPPKYPVPGRRWMSRLGGLARCGKTCYSRSRVGDGQALQRGAAQHSEGSRKPRIFSLQFETKSSIEPKALMY